MLENGIFEWKASFRHLYFVNHAENLCLLRIKQSHMLIIRSKNRQMFAFYSKCLCLINIAHWLWKMWINHIKRPILEWKRYFFHFFLYELNISSFKLSYWKSYFPNINSCLACLVHKTNLVMLRLNYSTF